MLFDLSSEQTNQVHREMHTVKEALTDFIYDNYNSTKQGAFLKTNASNMGLDVPLKDN